MKIEFFRNESDAAQVTAYLTNSARELPLRPLASHENLMIHGGDWSALSATTILPEIVFGSDFPSAIQWRSALDANADEEALLTEAFQLAAALCLESSLVSRNEAAAMNAPAALRAQALKSFISIIPIEDIFPNHAWDAHLNESLAACYHTLAAYFIKLADFDSALDCLRHSDTLEDSPRALALKALISQANGETLGAVANMVSSLQQYEQRKDPSAPHYVSFQPRDIEVVNAKLKDGLEALNRRDNETALNKFTEAVFNFDEFYDDLKLSDA